MHGGSCDVTVTLAVQGTDVASASGHLDLPGVLRVSPGIGVLPAGDCPPAGPGRAAPRYSERMS